MTSEQVTILIPDISGYTEFVSKTEVAHGTHLLNHLLETIVKSTNSDFVVSEIEGDAVLLYKKGTPPSKLEIIKQCELIFTSFHTQLNGIDSIRICQCVACLSVTNLTLKFVVHFGTISENKVSTFVKASGLDMIIAHRLLKNSIKSSEYLLLTKNYLTNIADGEEEHELAWDTSNESYSSIGMVEFQYASLEPFKTMVPTIPKMGREVILDSSAPLEIEIWEDFKEVFNTMTDLSARKEFVYALKEIEFIIPVAIIGMKFTYIFEDLSIIVEPINIKAEEKTIFYAEHHRIEELDVDYNLHFTLNDLGNKGSKFILHISPDEGATLSEKHRMMITTMQERTMAKFKELVEGRV
ncbi:MAG TPA: DUF2652 domain-containing protein [Saprospiraceae bacterium]|nr:DUF2652 domain-containing protein [Saprospiraceae bacterium]